MSSSDEDRGVERGKSRSNKSSSRFGNRSVSRSNSREHAVFRRHIKQGSRTPEFSRRRPSHNIFSRNETPLRVNQHRRMNTDGSPILRIDCNLSNILTRALPQNVTGYPPGKDAARNPRVREVPAADDQLVLVNFAAKDSGMNRRSPHFGSRKPNSILASSSSENAFSSSFANGAISSSAEGGGAISFGEGGISFHGGGMSSKGTMIKSSDAIKELSSKEIMIADAGTVTDSSAEPSGSEATSREEAAHTHNTAVQHREHVLKAHDMKRESMLLNSEFPPSKQEYRRFLHSFQRNRERADAGPEIFVRPERKVTRFPKEHGQQNSGRISPRKKPAYSPPRFHQKYSGWCGTRGTKLASRIIGGDDAWKSLMLFAEGLKILLLRINI